MKDIVVELLERLKKNQETMKAVLDEYGNGVLILPNICPHDTTPHIEIYENQKLIDRIEKERIK